MVGARWFMVNTIMLSLDWKTDLRWEVIIRGHLEYARYCYHNINFQYHDANVAVLLNGQVVSFPFWFFSFHSPAKPVLCPPFAT